MINEKLHLLLLLSLNKGNIENNRIILSSKHLNKNICLDVLEIKELCEWFIDSGYSEGIINQFISVVYDFGKHYNLNETNEDSMFTISNIYKRYLKKVRIESKTQCENFFFKLYSPEKIEVTSGELRGDFGRTWIDYESQLKDSDIIHDDIGIWVCSESKLSELLRSSSARIHYGNSIMILKMITGEKYLNQNDVEYIGTSFNVVYKQTLQSLDDYTKLKEQLFTISSDQFGYKSAIDFLERLIIRVNFHRDYYDVNNIDLKKLML